ncbi:TM2 domain-containing 1-like, partial [Paramuricea clavata]
IDECLGNSDNCHQNADCFNTIGSFYCDCKDGFNGNGTYCYVAEVSFTRASVAITEGEDIAVSFSLNGRIDTIAVVNVQVSGTATELVDYSSFTKAFFYNPGDPSTKTFTIRTIDDQRLEGLETIILTLSSIHSHVTPGNIPSMTITIVDNDAIGVAFSQQTYTVAENNGFANVIVQIQSGIVERDFIVSPEFILVHSQENGMCNATQQKSCDELLPGQYRCDETLQIDPDTQSVVGCKESHTVEVKCTIAPGIKCKEMSKERTFMKIQPCRYTNGYDHTTALMLSVFLGMFGIDRFYLGYPAIGLLKLCTLGFFFLLQLVDVILIAMQIVGPADGSEYVMDYYGPRLFHITQNNETIFQPV